MTCAFEWGPWVVGFLAGTALGGLGMMVAIAIVSINPREEDGDE